MEIISAIAIFVGAWLSWTVGYRINDWIAKIFTRKEKVVETKVIYTPATPVEVEQKLEQKALEESLDELSNEQLQKLVWLLEDMTDELTYEEETEHLAMYADNIKYLNLNTPTPRKHI